MAMKLVKIILAAALSAGCVAAQHMQSVVQPSPAFDKLKTLAGEWEGSALEGGKRIPARTIFRLVSDGSALMNRLGPDTPHEMITMFHMDGPELLATHYCSAHNQPRFHAVSTSDPNVVLFQFKDATNVAGPQVGRMDHVKFTLLDADHHIEEWSFLQNGKLDTGRFVFHRKK